jgi:hypothetical protein
MVKGQGWVGRTRAVASVKGAMKAGKSSTSNVKGQSQRIPDVGITGCIQLEFQLEKGAGIFEGTVSRAQSELASSYLRDDHSRSIGAMMFSGGRRRLLTASG